jgi:hypothetical protein
MNAPSSDLTPAIRAQLLAYFRDKAPGATSTTVPISSSGSRDSTVTVNVSVTGMSPEGVARQVEATLVKNAKFRRLMGAA